MYGLITTSACSWDGPKWTQDTLTGYPWSPGSLILHSIQHLDLISLPCGPGVSEDKENCIHCYRHHGKSCQAAALHMYFHLEVQPVDEDIGRAREAAMELVWRGEMGANQ